MANSKYEYVGQFETDHVLLPETWIVVRVDGNKFHRFSTIHEFARPNDLEALNLMNAAASRVIYDYPDIVLGYGQSDEFSFVFGPKTRLYGRRNSKLATMISSTFTAHYQFLWSLHKPSTRLCYPPSFDARVILYPTFSIVRDYLSWRQVDCHINNLYNTCFWSLVKSGLDPSNAEQLLQGTLSKDKHELLFSRFGINYNHEPEICKKGSVIIRCDGSFVDHPCIEIGTATLHALHVDIIQDRFWNTWGKWG